MTNEELIRALKRLLHGQRLSIAEANELHALIRQNTVDSLRARVEAHFDAKG